MNSTITYRTLMIIFLGMPLATVTTQDNQEQQIVVVHEDAALLSSNDKDLWDVPLDDSQEIVFKEMRIKYETEELAKSVIQLLNKKQPTLKLIAVEHVKLMLDNKKYQPSGVYAQHRAVFLALAKKQFVDESKVNTAVKQLVKDLKKLKKRSYYKDMSLCCSICCFDLWWLMRYSCCCGSKQ